jgi:tRNA 2-selenouridine synthase
MKAADTADITQCLATINTFDTVLDVRSESEFALDHIPGAINLPVLNDEQRATVGTLYKQTGSFEAKRVGAALVTRNIADALVAPLADKPRDWRPLIYCWRGGNRSGAMATILAAIGWRVTLLDGGYRSFRRHVNDALQTLPARLRYRVIAGRTGSAKSALLQLLQAQGAQVLDLEDLAKHRGSVLGSELDRAQPSQKWFETLIWSKLQEFDPDRPVYIESESKKVGQNHVPDALIRQMRASPCIVIDASESFRIEHLLREYRHFVEQPQLLLAQLNHLRELHGVARIDSWSQLILSNRWHELVQELLSTHYDPSYDRSMKRNFSALEHALVVPVDSSAEHSLAAAAAKILHAESAVLLRLDGSAAQL